MMNAATEADDYYGMNLISKNNRPKSYAFCRVG
jgi:hypothetical protein